MDVSRFYACSDELSEVLAVFEPDFILDGATTIYVLTSEYRLAAYDVGWVNFARENHGDMSRLGLGVDVLEVMPRVLRLFYERVYRYCLRREATWRHHYQCSSPKEFRVFEEVVAGLPGGTGLLVANFLGMSKPVEEEHHEADSAQYANPLTGTISQCACCRQVLNPRNRRWVRVPEWVRRSPSRVAHELCPTCYLSTYQNPGKLG